MRTFPELLDKYQKFLVIFSVLVFFTNFDQFTQRYGIIPLYWIYVLILLFLPVIAIAVMTRPIHIAPIIWWCAGFLMISTLGFYHSLQTPTNFQAVQTHYLSIIFIVVMLVAFANEDHRLLARKVSIVALLIGVTLNIYELFNPMTFSMIAGRSTGLFANSNQSGQALVVAMCCAFGVVRPRWRLPLVIVTIAGVIPTFSRSGMVAWAISVVALYFLQGLKLSELKRLLLVPIVLVAFVYSPLWGNLEHTLTERGVLNADTLQRLDFIGSGGQDVQDESAEGREHLAGLAWERFKMSPWIGWGTGSYYLPPFPLGPHNVYLGMMVDYGMIGIPIYPMLMIVTLIGVNRESAKVAVSVVLALTIYGFFSHNMLEQRATFVALTIAAAEVDALRKRPIHAIAEPFAFRPRVSQPTFQPGEVKAE